MTINDLMTAFRIAIVLKADEGLYGFKGNTAFNSLATQVYEGASVELKGGGAVVIKTNGGNAESTPTKGSDVIFTGVYE